jgi:cell division septal protein FtsQ
MTEKKRLPEQMALHTYKRRSVVTRSAGEQLAASKRSYQESRRVVKPEAPRSSQRVVTVPDADPSSAWNTFAQRQSQMRRARSRPKASVKLAARTYAQTGMWASSGRMRAVRMKSAQLSSPIPMRSGRGVRKRNFLLRLLGVLIVGVLSVLAVDFVLTSSLFRVEQVQVVGTHNAALIRSIQKMELQWQNIFLVNVSALTEKIEAMPLVSSVSISKQLPNQLIVTIVERTPVLLWQNSQGLYSVDKQGVVIAAESETPGASNLPTVVDMSNQGTNAEMYPGLHLDQTEIMFAVELLDRLPQVVGLSGFKLYYDGTIYASNKNEMVGASSRGSYIVESPDGWKAYLGDATDANPLDNRLLELRQILALARKQQLNLAAIDLRYGLRPVYTLK